MFFGCSTGNLSADNAFLSPRWGGLHIHNLPSPGEGEKLPKPSHVDMKHVMQVFISQLRLLIGVHPQVLALSLVKKTKNNRETMIDKITLQPLAWRGRGEC